MRHSRPATQPLRTGSPLCLSLRLLISLATNLAQKRRQVLFLPSVFLLPLSVLARLCQAQRLILSTGWLCSGLPRRLPLPVFICLPSSAIQPKVSVHFLTGHVQAVTDAAVTPLPPPETDPDGMLGVCCFSCLLSLRPHRGEQTLIPPLHIKT